MQKRVEETGVTRQRLYRLMRRWWQRGMTIAALTPDTANSGAPGERKPLGHRKRGAPVQGGVQGMNVDDSVRRAFQDTVARHFARNKKIDIDACYHQCLDEHFSDLVLNPETGRQETALREAHPSLRQFRYWLEQDNDLFALARKRRTPRVYDKDSRAILGNSTQRLMREMELQGVRLGKVVKTTIPDTRARLARSTGSTGGSKPLLPIGSG